MSKIKDTLIGIEEMLAQNHDPVYIANILGCPIDWVYSTEATVTQGMDHYYDFEFENRT